MKTSLPWNKDFPTEDIAGWGAKDLGRGGGGTRDLGGKRPRGKRPKGKILRTESTIIDDVAMSPLVFLSDVSNSSGRKLQNCKKVMMMSS